MGMGQFGMSGLGGGYPGMGSPYGMSQYGLGGFGGLGGLGGMSRMGGIGQFHRITNE